MMMDFALKLMATLLIIEHVSTHHDPTWCRFVGIAGCQDSTIKRECTALCSLQRGCPKERGYTRLPGTRRCFKLFMDEIRNWNDSFTKCNEEGMVMVKTTDADAFIIRESLVNKYGTAGSFAWLAAKYYHGAGYIWNDGERIRHDNGLWESGSINKPNYCLLMLNNEAQMIAKPLKPYGGYDCSIPGGRRAFCELI